jgi:lysophospholipase L1-like esterase
MRGRGLTSNILLSFVTVPVALAIAEVIVRIVHPQPIPSQDRLRSWALPGMYVADDSVGYRLAPDFAGRLERRGVVTEFRTNSLGLRAPELGPRREGLPRIAAFGDSLTFGWGVAQGEEWVGFAERELAVRLAPSGAEFVNCGVGGYGTRNELALLALLGPALAPDLVIAGFYPNDLTDNLRGLDAYTVRDGVLFDERSAAVYRENALARASHLVRLVSAGWQAWRERWLELPPGARPLGAFSIEELREGERLSAELLLRMAEESRALGARFGVVWLPTEKYVRAGAAVPLQQRLQREVEVAGLPALDLLPVFAAEPDVASLYLPDRHFSTAGNRAVGRAVANWLLAVGLLERDSSPPPSSERTR